MCFMVMTPLSVGPAIEREPCPAAAGQVAKLENARVEMAVFEKAEHLVLNTAPRLVIPRVAEWLERRVSGGG
jgi:hypothetical protein